jgi:hypothetical protein
VRVLLLSICSFLWIAHGQDLGYLEVLEKAQDFEKQGDTARAFLAYSQAALLAPKDSKVWFKSLALRRRATIEAGVLPKDDGSGMPASDYEPETIDEKELAEARRLLPPVRLAAADPDRRRQLDLRGDSKEAWEQFARLFGVDVVFDGDYQPRPGVSIRLDAATYGEALLALEHATGTFLTPVSERIGLVAQDTQAKRQELQHNVAMAIPLPEPVTPQEAQELARTVQQLMELQKFTVDSRIRMALMRGPLHKVIPARQIFDQLVSYRPDVAIEVQFLEVARNSEYSYGMRLPTQFPIVWLNQVLKGNSAAPAGYKNFGAFGGGKTLFGIGLIGPEFYATFSRSDAQTLLQTQIRSTSGQPATYHVGDRYPIITAGYFGDVSGAPPGARIYTPPPTFNFEDLGIVLKMTPWVHDRNDISLAVEAEFKVLTGASTNGIPVIASRKFVTQVRLRDGEWAVMSGLVTATEVRAFTGLIGISQIPYLGHLFRENTRIDQHRDALIAIRPMLLGDPPPESVTRAIWTGSETKPRAGM